MLEPQIGDDMGIGFFLDGAGDAARFEHDGSNEGFLSAAGFYKSGGRGAVIMINSNEGGPLLGEILRALAREYNWPGILPPSTETSKVAEAALDALTGEYETAAKLRFTVARQGESLLLTAGSQPPLTLVPQSDTSFLLGPLNGKVTFEKDAQSRGRRLTLLRGGVPTTAERIGAPPM